MLPKLEHLWLRQNKITVLPDSIDEMALLKTLSVSSNRLNCLPGCISGMHTLENIYANGNQISAVADSLCSLPSLKELNLGNNSITVFPSVWTEMWGPLDLEKGQYMGHDYDPVEAARKAKGDIPGGDGGSTAKCKVTVMGNPVTVDEPVDEPSLHDAGAGVGEETRPCE